MSEERRQPPQLSELDRQILDFMRRDYKYKGARDLAIQQEFQLSAIQFFQRLNHLLDTEAALAHDPILVNQLRRNRQNPFTAR
ncbi:DUF3263 domain-containing protein [Micrococcoides hystricis]|uniref:DUF3263 domain-containing protein n=1 Tax=Micrococcoides hystricis TaxID=1572761 RepID=A0ABV6P9M3_9MICC